MVSIGPKFFYTRSLPCTLWFFDKGKSQDRLDHVLMLDARSVYTVVSAKSHVFTDAQLSALTAIVWLTRGETHKYNALLAGYLREIAEQLTLSPHTGAHTVECARNTVGRLGKKCRAANTRMSSALSSASTLGSSSTIAA